MTFSVEDHIRLRRVTSIAASPDGGCLVVALERLDREGARYASDLWRVPTDGSDAVQLTRGDTRDTSPAFRDDGALAFLSNRAPNEAPPDEDAEKRMQVWVLPVEGGEPRQLTDEPLGVEGFAFARRAPRLVALAPVISGVADDKQRETAAKREKNGPGARRYTRQPVRHWDHWLHDDPDRANTHVIRYGSDGSGRTDLTPDAKREFGIEPELAVSDDGRLAALTRQTPGQDREIDTHVLLFDLAGGTTRVLGEGVNVNYEQVHFSPDGETVAVIRSTRSPQRAVRPRIVLIHTSSGEERTLDTDEDLWFHLAGWTPDGGTLIASADVQGITPVFAVDTGTARVRRMTSDSAGGHHSGIEVLSDGRVGGIRSTMLEAPECFLVGAQDTTPRTLARLSGFEPADWAEAEDLRVTSTDGVEVQSWLLKPRGAAEPLPTLVWIHGGPIGMSTDGWHWRWNPLIAVAAGYAVALPNPRGSTGFGQDFIQGIWGNVWGDQCYQDLMAVTDALAARPDIDPNRMMAMGGSFGGYMTNWIGTQTDRFRCLITHASIFTMAQFTGTTDHPAWWYLEMGGEDPYADPASFDRYAPVRHVKNWKTPTLVFHGERDYRCPINEGLNLFEALQYHGVPSELIVFPEENHWILKPLNAVVWYEAVLEFLSRHMGTPREDVRAGTGA